ncbi:MAG: LysR family transcriptional regulator, partial [Peptococcaceae bacterium]|nr:LysR family transcriptional regulator [Peptococcaceae bacterium]
MELLQLQYFKTIAECQHITKAANKLMISQPSLSNTLSRIEAELGVQLFDRQGRNIVLNQYGKIVLEHAHNILRELDNIRTEIDAMQQRQEKVITIASTDSMYLREWLPSFIRANPDLTIRHTVSTIEKIETDLLNGVIDFGISSAVSDNPSFEHYTLWEDEYVVITPHPNDLPAEPVRNFADFAKMPFVALPALDYQSRSIDIMSNAVDITPNIIFEGERELLERVMLPLHASIVALRSTIKEDSDMALASKYCDVTQLSNPEAHITVTLSWDSRRTQTAAAQRLLDYVYTNDVNAWRLTTPDEVWEGRRQ